MARSELGFPVFVGARVSPAQYPLHLLIGPGIQIDRLDSTDMGSHASVNAGTSNADKDTQVPTGPSWI
jgi:hypothetical protein